MEKAQVQVLANAKGKPGVSAREGNVAKKGKAYCHRCCSKGHLFVDCTEVLYCQICESDEHVATKCPLKKNRPMAHMVGSGIDNLGFFYIPHGTIQTDKKDCNTALVKVQGGQLTEEQLIGHLKRLVPGNFEWSVQVQAPNVWVALFPSKVDLQRTINLGRQT